MTKYTTRIRVTDYAQLLKRLDDGHNGLWGQAAAAIRELYAEVLDLRDSREHLNALLRRAQAEREEAQADAWNEGKAAGITQVTAAPGTFPVTAVQNPYRWEDD